ncbi:hypothetical protein PMI42_01723 [Bradyrhizobium sp. YR681]|uniref:phage capsid family protein n=1 Tax=Bradyrhizobium sp. YR681 TaxID=1144344 RepID=UPI0002712A5D|nr:DUF4043 family protein [Bradyrhizobium sp. YR681]EJN14749.1 hypothetical protein PMI42_01723 [Bradyrhizobium sp. YR681]
MALTTTAANNKLIYFRKEIYREYVRENLFSPYMGPSMNAIIRVITDLDKGGKNGGEQINIPLRARLNGQGVGSGQLRGNEEALDNQGTRMWIDWSRHAVTINNAEEQKSSVDLYAEIKPALTDWGQEKQRDEIVDGFYALPSQNAPAGLGSANGQRVNGILFDAATAAQRNTWITDNADRILVGNGNTANLVAGNFAASMANVTGAMVLSGALVNRMKRSAKKANPRIRPFKLKENGTEWFVLFVGQEQFRDAQNDADIKGANQNSRARENQGYLKNPIFVDGDLLYNGVIIREIPEMSLRLPVFYQTAGSGGIQIAPAFLCGQGAMAWCWGKMPTPTFLKEDDYQFLRGAGIKMAYGVGKIAKLNAAGNFKEWGVYTAFLAAVGDN